MIKWLFFLLILITLSACETGVMYQHTEKLDNEKWAYDSELVYNVEALDTSKYYELVVIIKYDIDFSYANFYTKITTEFPSGEKLDDVVSFQLADKMGSWIADCSGSTCTSDLILQTDFRFKEAGDHKISIENFSREELVGIKSIELKLYDVAEM